MKTRKIITIIVVLLIIIGTFSACAKPDIYNSGGSQLSEETLEWGKFDVNYIEMTSIYSYMVYDANGDFFMADGYIYFIDPYLSRMKPDGADRQALPDEVKNFWLYDATYSDGWIYFIDERYGYFDTVPPPGTNENLFRMRPDGTDLQECVKDVYCFRIVDGWIVYQSGYKLFAAKIDDWGNKLSVFSEAWNIRAWIVHENYIFLSTQKTQGGSGQYNSKMYRCDLNGGNAVLLENDAGTPFTPLFVYDGYLYYRAYNDNNGNIIYRMGLDGKNINAVINPQRYVLLDNMRFIDDWLYYVYSWIDKDNSYQTVSTVRKVCPDGTGDQEVSAETNWFTGKTFGEVTVWIVYSSPIIQTGMAMTRQMIFAGDSLNNEVMLFDGQGLINCQKFYAWNGNLYILTTDYRTAEK